MALTSPSESNAMAEFRMSVCFSSRIGSLALRRHRAETMEPALSTIDQTPYPAISGINTIEVISALRKLTSLDRKLDIEWMREVSAGVRAKMMEVSAITARGNSGENRAPSDRLLANEATVPTAADAVTINGNCIE